MPTQRSGQIAYSDIRNYYGGGYPIYNSSYRGRDGSWNNGAMYNSDSYYVRPRPWFVPAPGPERLTFWFYSGGWYLRFNPTCAARGNTDFGLSSGTIMYFYGLKPTTGIPSQFDGIWTRVNFFGPWNGGYRTFGMQAHNGVSGYRATLGYWWQIGSDYRLKSNITSIGTSNGHNLYTWEWNNVAKKLGMHNAPTTGVIAQEVLEYMPEAVMKHNGFYKVDYRMLGLL